MGKQENNYVDKYRQQQTTKDNALLWACRYFGGRRKLALMIGVSSSRINNWLNRGDAIPYHFALLIEAITQQKVTREQL